MSAALPPTSSEHYSWNASTAQRAAELTAAGVSVAPRRLDGGSTSTSSEAASSPSVAKSPVASSWNAAGTWEERNVSSAALAALRARLVALRVPPQRGLALHVISAEVSGDVKLIHVRGKVRVGFELSVSATWELHGDGGARAAAGTLSFEAEDTEAGFFDALRVVVSRADACASGEAVSVVKVADGAVREAMSAWVEELKKGAA